MDTAAATTEIYTAQFVKAAHADGFAEGLAAWGGGSITNIAHRKGRRTVTFEAPAGWEFYMDVAEFVGYHGSPPQGPVATLNGIRTPRSY